MRPRNLQTSEMKRAIRASALLLENAGARGDTDVLPMSFEYRLLRGYSKEVAHAVWSTEQEATVEIIEVPLSRFTTRDVHSLDATSFLRFGGAAIAMANVIEEHRAPASVATAVRWAPNQSRSRLVEPGSFGRWDTSLEQIQASFPFVFELDMALFFPSLDADVVHRALARWAPAGADLVHAEIQRLGISGLPVGGIPARILGEAVLHDVDRALLEAGRKHVRRMDVSVRRIAFLSWRVESPTTVSHGARDTSDVDDTGAALACERADGARVLASRGHQSGDTSLVEFPAQARAA